MVTPLFKSLPHASYGHWSEEIDVIKTQTFVGVELLTESADFHVRAGDDVAVLRCQETHFRIQLDGPAKLRADGGDVGVKTCHE